MGEGDLAEGKKNATRQRALIVFLDESGFSERPAVRRTWAPRGETPVLVHKQASWKQLSAIGALGYRTHSYAAAVYLMLVAGVVRSPQVVRFVKHLHRHVRGRVILLWDGLHSHRSKETNSFLAAQSHWLTVHRLPGYAPELNPRMARTELMSSTLS